MNNKTLALSLIFIAIALIVVFFVLPQVNNVEKQKITPEFICANLEKNTTLKVGLGITAYSSLAEDIDTIFSKNNISEINLVNGRAKQWIINATTHEILTINCEVNYEVCFHEQNNTQTCTLDVRSDNVFVDPREWHTWWKQ